MAQGTRGRWVRIATTGLGVLVCSTLVGCMNTDKDKTKLAGKQPTPSPGLYGTQTLPNGAVTRPPAANPYGTNGVQQTGGLSQQRVGSTGLNTLNTQAPQQNFGGPSYNAPTTIGAPMNPNPSFVPSPLPNQGGYQPAGNTTAPSGWSGYNTSAPSNPVANASATLPAGFDPLPPPPPDRATAAGAGSAVLPPSNSFAPVAPLPPSSTVGALVGK